MNRSQPTKALRAAVANVKPDSRSVRAIQIGGHEYFLWSPSYGWCDAPATNTEQEASHERAR